MDAARIDRGRGKWLGRRVPVLVFVFALVAMQMVAVPGVAEPPGVIPDAVSLVSTVDGGTTTGNDFSKWPRISGDGTVVTFSSRASDLVLDDTNESEDVFVYESGVVERVSLTDGDSEATGNSWWPSISNDGRYVAFLSAADDLVTGDTNGQVDVFVRDRELNTTIRVNLSENGDQTIATSSNQAWISGDGKAVVFDSGDQLVSDDANLYVDVYLRDLHNPQTPQTIGISVDGNGMSNWPDVSYDGAEVAFVSVATNLIPGGTDGTQHCYHYDVTVETLTIVDFGDDAAEANGHCHQPKISGDGTVVTYHSEATNLVEDDGNGLPDVFVYDLEEFLLVRASVAANGGDTFMASFHPSLNHDGRFVAFQSHSEDLVPTTRYSAEPGPNDENGFADVFVRDLWTDQTVLVSMLPDGTRGNEGSYAASISDDGRYVTFHSFATNLAPDDVNTDPDGRDVFLADRGPVGEVFTVDSTGDSGDDTLGDGECLSTLGGCTLRAAIEEANAHAGRDYIFFDIPGAGPHTISPAADYPHVSEGVVIDARTQPGFPGGTQIILDGGAAPSPSAALFLLTGDSFVGGLGIANFGTGISVIDGNLLITSNVITGGNYGIVVLDTSTAVVEDNIISGNATNGIQVDFTAVAWILGNEIVDNGDAGITNYGTNHPGPVTLTHASTGGYTTISGSLPTPATDFTLHVYGNSVCDPSGFGEGEYLLFEHLYDGPPTDTFTVTVPQGFGPGTITTATVSGPVGSDQGTSAFSNCVTMNDASFIEVAADQDYDWVDLINLQPEIEWSVSVFEDEFAVSPLQTELITTDVDGNGRANFNLDIIPGNFVLAEHGVQNGYEAHSTIVVPVTVDTWDTDADFIDGAADPGATVVVLVENPASTFVEFFVVAADGGGYWSIDFAGLGYDFPFSFGASARIVDADGDTTLAHAPPGFGDTWEHLTFQFGPDNRNPDSLNEHLDFRRAIAHAIDKDSIAAIMSLAPIDSYVAAIDPALSQDAWAQYDYDPTAAATLIDQLCVDLARDCVNDPPTVVFTTNDDRPARVALAAALEPMLEAVGIQMIPDLEDTATFFGDTIGNSTFDLAEWAWGGSDLVAIHDIFDPDGDSNYYRWGTPDSSVINPGTIRFAELRDLMDGATDEAELIGYINEAEQIVADQVVVIPLGIRIDALLDPGVTITADPAVTEPGASEVPLSAIPIDRLAPALGNEAGPGATPLGSIQLAGTPLGSIPLGSIPLGSIAVEGTPLGSILLSSVPLGSIGGWDAILAGTVLQGMPLQTITLTEVFAAATTDPALAGALAALPLGSIDLAGSPLGSIPLGSILLGAAYVEGTPLGSIPLGSIPLGSIPLGSIPLGSIPLGSIPLGSIPLGSIPLGSIPLGSIPLGSIPFGSIPLGSIPLGSIDLAGTPLGSIPLGSINVGGDFCTFFDAGGSPTCADLGITDPSTQTLYDLVLALEGVGLTLAVTPLGSIPLGSIDLGLIPLGSIPLGSIPLGSIPLGSIDLAGTPLGSIQLGSIDVGGDFCTWLAGAGGPTCAALGITASNTLYEFALGVEALGSTLGATPLGSIPLGSIPLGSIPLGSIPLGSIPLGSIDLTGTPLGSVPLGSINVGGDFCTWLANGGGPTCAALGIDGTETLYEFALAVEAIGSTVDATPLGSIPLGSIGLDFLYGPGLVGDVAPGSWGDLTVGDLLFALMLESDYAWEDVPLDAIGIQDFIAGPTVDYELSFSVTGSGGAVPATATVDLPAGFRYVAGSGAFGNGQVSVSIEPVLTEADGAQQLTWHLTVAPDGFILGFSAAPGLSLGTFSTAVEIALPGLEQSAFTEGAPVTVEEALAFTTNDAPETAYAVGADALYLPHIAESDAVSYFAIPVPAAGKRTAVFLSHLGTDADLVMYRPVSAVPEPPGARSVPLGSIPFEDDGLDFTGEQPLEPDTLADIALETLPLGSISTNRGTTDEAAAISQRSDPAPGDEYTIQVSGYEGATSDDAYVLRVKVVDEAPIPVCPGRTFPFGGEGVAGTYDSAALPAGLEAVFLVNYERLGDLYGGAAAGGVETALNAMTAYLTGTGMPAAVIAIGDAIGSATYVPWDTNPCDPNAANAVSTAISGLLAGIRADHPTLTYVTLVGSDEVIPLARIPDLTVLANEKQYAATFSGNALYGTLATSHFLSDDPYGDVDPIPWLDRYLHVPELGVGRLIETPDQIVAQLDRFHHPTVAGTLEPTTAFVSGYDFLSDGAAEVESNLAPEYSVTALISETWDDVALIAGLASADVLSPNAHYDHYRALPADQSAAGTETELVTTGDIPVTIDDGIVFTMGCHGGLNVPDTASGGAETVDWAQTYAGTGAVYVANSGYGYGDTATVALSELLMAEFADHLDGSLTAGRALAFAKQAYFSDLGLHGVYDEKALQQAVFYGLPMYEIGAGTLPAPPPEPETEIEPVTGLAAAAFSLDLGPLFTLETSPAGEYYTVVENETLGIHYRPIQPRFDVDVTVDGLIAMGAVFTDLATTDVPLPDPAFLRPTIDYAPVEPEVETADVIFPTTFQTIATYHAPSDTGAFEQRQQLNITPGQYRGGDPGIQRLFTSFDSLVYYAPEGVADFTTPVISRVDAAIVGGIASFVVEATDDAGIARVLVLYRDGPTTWNAVDLVAGSPWTGGGPVGPGITEVDYMVQVVDVFGNVGVSTFKGLLYEAAAIPEVPDDPDVTIEADPGSSGWYTGPATITVTADPPMDLFYSIDGVDHGLITGGQFLVTGDGTHIIEITGDGYAATFGIAIDATPPEIEIATPSPGAVYQLGDIIAASFACPDAGAGITTCSGSTADGAFLPTGQIGTFSLDVTAIDAVGHQTGVSAGYTVVGPVTFDATPNPTEIDQQVTATALFTPGPHPITVIVDWGDGSTCTTGLDPDCTVNGGTATAVHSYADPGVYSVNLSVLHNGVLTQTADEVFLAVFDPTAGSVSGHGRITSPSGAFPDDPLATPEVKFGISAKYKKGAIVPTGSVKIDVRDHGSEELDFKAETLTSLFVAGDFALIKGSGETATGIPIWFEATVLDADLTDGVIDDAFRIKIRTAGGLVLYDSGLGVPAWDPEGMTPLFQGQIKIRKK